MCQLVSTKPDLEQFMKWEAAEAIGAAFELAIFALAVWTLTWRVKMPKSKKAIIVSSFGLRFVYVNHRAHTLTGRADHEQRIIIAVITARLTSFDKTGFFTDPTLHEAVFVCWTQAEMNLSIIAATIPIAHKFLSSLVTNYGGAGGRNLSERTNLKSPKTNEAAGMASIESAETATTTKKSENSHNETYMHRGEDRRYSYGINGGRNRPAPTEDQITNISDATSVKSTESRKMIIRKDVTYQVDFGN